MNAATYVIAGATIVDVSNKGRTAHDIADAVVIVKGGRIASAGPRGTIRIPPGTRVIDAHGQYLIPGLIDGLGAARSPAFAKAYLHEGVTTILVPIVQASGQLDGEAGIAAGSSGLSVLTASPVDGHAADRNRLAAQDLVRAVRVAAGRGDRAIIVGPDVSSDQLKVAVQEAHRSGIAVLAELASTGYADAIRYHVDAFVRHDKYQLWLSNPSAAAAYMSDPRGPGARAAMRSICGSDPIDQAIAGFARHLSRGRTALMPALAMEATADGLGGGNPWQQPAAAFFTPADLDDPVDPLTGARPFLLANAARQDAIRACAIRKQQIDGKLHARGAAYLTGSSAPGYGVMPGSGVHLEIELLQAIGLSPREALATATGNFAAYLGWHDRGLVATGRRADLVLLDKDPRKDSSALESIVSVFAAGREIDRDRLLQEAGGNAHQEDGK